MCTATNQLKAVLATVRSTDLEELNTHAAIKSDLIYSMSQIRRSFTQRDLVCLSKYLKEADEIVVGAELDDEHPIYKSWTKFFSEANDKIVYLIDEFDML